MNRKRLVRTSGVETAAVAGDGVVVDAVASLDDDVDVEVGSAETGGVEGEVDDVEEDEVVAAAGGKVVAETGTRSLIVVIAATAFGSPDIIIL